MQVNSKIITEPTWRDCVEFSCSWNDLRKRLGFKKPKHRVISYYQKRVIKKNCKNLNISLEHIESSVSDEEFKQYVQEASTWNDLSIKMAYERLHEDNFFFHCARRDVRKRCDRLDINYDHLDGIKIGEHDTLSDYRYLNNLN